MDIHKLWPRCPQPLPGLEPKVKNSSYEGSESLGAGGSWEESQSKQHLEWIFFRIDVNYAKGAEGLCEFTSLSPGGTDVKQAHVRPPGESPTQQALPLLLLKGKALLSLGMFSATVDP